MLAVPTQSINSLICPPRSTLAQQRIVVSTTIDFLGDKTMAERLLRCIITVFYSAHLQPLFPTKLEISGEILLPKFYKEIILPLVRKQKSF